MKTTAKDFTPVTGLREFPEEPLRKNGCPETHRIGTAVFCACIRLFHAGQLFHHIAYKQRQRRHADRGDKAEVLLQVLNFTNI